MTVSPRTLALVALAALAAAAGCRRGPAEPTAGSEIDLPVPDFVEHLRQGRLGPAYQATCPEYQAGHDLARFEHAVRSMPYFEGMAEPRVTAVQAGASARAETVRYQSRHGQLDLELRSRSDDGAWCVASVEVLGIEVLWRSGVAAPGLGAPPAEAPEGGDEGGGGASAEEVEILLDSQPSEVSVLAVPSGRTVCTTPCRLTLPRGQTARFQFERTGYRPETRTVVAERDTVLLVTLRAAR